MIILIPPSEGKASGGNLPPKKKIHPITKELLVAIATDNNPEKLYGVKGNKLEESIQANTTITTQQTLPAIQKYTGVVYDGFDYNSLSKSEQTYAHKHIKIISALFGLVSLEEPIPNYKLKIDKLQAATLWKEHNSKQVEKEFVIDLLPKAHRKAVAYTNGIAVEFVILKNNKRIPAGHNGKFIKGRFLRWLVQNKITNKESFGTFTEDGFRWNGTEFVKEIN
jgi:hypothetical protein